MKKFALTKVDIGFIIAFVVISLLGFGGYWYLTGQLTDAQLRVAGAKSKYDKYSKDTKFKVAVNPANVKVLQDNIAALKAQIDPLIPEKLQPKASKLRSIPKEDPVAWKHDLDDNVHRLAAEAKSKNVTLPNNFYFGFVRYLSQSPGDEQTIVLSKQLLAVDQIASILIKAPVRGINYLSRTYEEDPKPAGQGIGAGEKDHMPGYSFNGPDNAYISYPFEIEFVTTAESLRPIVNDLLQSPYIFVIRSVTVTNSAPTSPHTNELDGMAGTPPPGDNSGAAAVTKGPQYLFGDSTITVKMRIDMIEWKGDQK